MSVKEQRVDGNCTIIYCIKVYSKKYWKIFLFDKSSTFIRKSFQLTNNLWYYSTLSKSLLDISNNNILDSYFITGITDAEGCFVCIVRKSAWPLAKVEELK